MSEDKKRNIFVHIGFGKTSTSKLQKDVFPLLCEYIGFKFWGDEFRPVDFDTKLADVFTNLATRMILGMPCKKLELPNNLFISNEELSSYRDAEHILEFAEYNLSSFGKDTHIILTIREPRQWLTSVYMQLCYHENPIQEPEHFFLNNSNYSDRLPDSKFNVDKFSYINIIEKYRDLFDNFTVVKYESLTELNFLNDLFKLTDYQLDELRKSYKKGSVNVAVSKASMNLVNKFNNFLTLFKCSYKSKYNNAVLLERASYDFMKKQKTNKFNNINIFKLIINKFFNLFHYKILLFKIVDNILKYEKYNLNFDKLKYIDINHLEKEYKSIPEYITYRK